MHNLAALESAVAQPRMTFEGKDLYPTVEDKAAALAFFIIQNHPFMDGNGRTTRLATKVLLTQMGLNTFNLFSFENYYNKNVTRYFQYVGERGDYYDLKDKIDFTNWLEYFTEGIIDELLRVQEILPQITTNPANELQEITKS